MCASRNMHREAEQQETKSSSADVSRLLRAWSDGDQSALDRLTPIVYEELRRLARRHLRGERAGHSLQATALVNEAMAAVIVAASVTPSTVSVSADSPPVTVSPSENVAAPPTVSVPPTEVSPVSVESPAMASELPETSPVAARAPAENVPPTLKLEAKVAAPPTLSVPPIEALPVTARLDSEPAPESRLSPTFAVEGMRPE